VTSEKDIVIAAPCRTAQGKLGGALRGFTNQALGTILIKGILQRSGLDPGKIDEVILGCAGQQADAQNVARVCAVQAGIPVAVPAFTVNRNCASGLQAIASAAHAIRAGEAEIVIAGGVEVMSSAPYVNRDLRFGKRIRNSMMIDSLWEGLRDPLSGMMMGETADLLARQYKISREEQDACAVESHRRACSAAERGIFRDEILPVDLSGSGMKKEVIKFARDEGPNALTTPDVLRQLPPAFSEKGTVTAGNACPISDGAAGMIVTTRSKADGLGLEVFGKLRSISFTGVEPAQMGLGPVPAVERILSREGRTRKDIPLWEINEAFAAQYLAVERELGLDRDSVNVNGGGIALGHPVGATGARLVVTLLHEMRRRQLVAGMSALCIGGGQGAAALFERCD